MSDEFYVKSNVRDYRVVFEDWETSIGDILKDGDFVILDSQISRLYPKTKELNCSKIFITASESSKSYDSIGKVMTELLERGFSRNNKLIAIGGGVTQDVTSFAASVLMRGVEWVFYPTNLLSQGDSCIGSKTSVNLGVFKNQIGGFYPPSTVFIDTRFCSSLTSRDICSGLGELAHYILVDGSTPINDLSVLIEEAKSDLVARESLIKKSLLIKKTMIEIDEFDQGPRCVFNYGHTFGHAIEASTNYEVPHGVAVAYGMDLANVISVEFNLVDKNFRNTVRQVLEKIWTGIPIPDFEINSYAEALKRDKKSVPGFIKPILSRGLGDMFQDKVPLKPELITLIKRYFDERIHERKI